MRTRSSHRTTAQARARLKVTSGLAGLAITGILLTACTSSAAGAAKPQPGQYRQATYSTQAANSVSEREMLRKEHLVARAPRPSQVKLSGTPTDDRESLRQEHLAR